jgi:hypothetical protein
MVKTFLQSKASLRNYHEKIKEIRMDAPMYAAHVSLCQLQLCETFSSRKDFYAIIN